MKIVGLGAGGHAQVVADAAEASGHTVVGLLERDRTLWGSDLQGLTVLGSDDLLVDLLSSGGAEAAFIGVGGTGDNRPRSVLYQWLLRLDGLVLPPIVHPRSTVSGRAQLSAACVVMAGAVVNVGAVVGQDAIVNTGALVEHHVVIGAHAHIAPGAVLSGGVTVCELAHVGAGAVVRQSVRIGVGAVIGAGAVVLHDVPDGVTVAGVPARTIQQS